MNKHEFLAVLKRELYILPQNELKEQLNFYSEMIDDGVEEGLTEEQAVSKIGSISEILSQINSEKTQQFQEVKTERKEKKRVGAWTIILLVLGSPIWISLLAAMFAVIVVPMFSPSTIATASLKSIRPEAARSIVMAIVALEA